MNIRRTIDLFLGLAALVLVVSALAKADLAMRTSGAADSPDSTLPFLMARQLVLLSALMELAVAGFVSWNPNRRLRLGAVLWLSSLILVYRVGQSWIRGIAAPCPCLGRLPTALGLSAGVDVTRHPWPW